MQPNSSQLVSLDLRHSDELGGAAVIDPEAFAILESLADEDDPDLVKEIIELFLDDSETRMAQIEEGLKSDSSDAIRAAAHALKSASANVGALSFSAACAELEGAALPDSDAELSRLVESACQLYADVRTALSGPSSADA